MKIYNRYILTVSIMLLLTTVILAALGQDSLDVYYTAYVIEALAVTELYAYFSNGARRQLSFVSLILLSGFLFIVSLQAIKILA